MRCLVMSDEIMGFRQEGSDADDTQARIKVLGHREGSVLPNNGEQPAITRISPAGQLGGSVKQPGSVAEKGGSRASLLRI